MGMEKLTILGMKNSSTLAPLINNFLNNLRDENNEPIYTYIDNFMTNFVRNSFKSGRSNACNQHNKSEISDEVFHFISKKFRVNDNVCHLLEKCF